MVILACNFLSILVVLIQKQISMDVSILPWLKSFNFSLVSTGIDLVQDEYWTSHWDYIFHEDPKLYLIL